MVEELLKASPEEVRKVLQRVFNLSPCLREFLKRHPEEVRVLSEINLRKGRRDYLKELGEYRSQFKKLSELLAFYRHRELLRIFIKELSFGEDYREILWEYSELAYALVEFAYEELRRSWGDLRACVVALGKLGSYELNYYSDLDLMFLHAQGGREEEYWKFFRELLRVFNEGTEEGEPYRIDLDLRPFGKRGNLSVSLDFAEFYYESYARTWERFALLRASYCAGDRELYGRFYEGVVKPFVFGRATDYSLIEEMRILKKKLEAHTKGKSLGGFNLKTGYGGIRELEFFVQSLVLFFGSRDEFLREKNTFLALWKLNQRGIITDSEFRELLKAYTFLRKLENRLQLLKCYQTHRLSDWEVESLKDLFKGELLEELRKNQEVVRKHFNRLLPQKEVKLNEVGEALLKGEENLREILREYGFSQGGSLAKLLTSLCERSLGKEKLRLIEVISKLIESVKGLPNKEEGVKNFVKFVSNDSGKRIILSKDKVLELLFKVFTFSQYFSHLIAQNPDLVDDILTLYQDFPRKEELKRELREYLRYLKKEEREIYRSFKRVWEVRLGLLYLTREEEEEEKLKKLFNALSELAEVILESLWERMGMEGVSLYALGKFGSKEITYFSDLDLIFVLNHGSKEKALGKVRELLRELILYTPSGNLYTVDLRLRPMGSGGELLQSLEYFLKYFKGKARTWERLAWVRSRHLLGEDSLRDAIEEFLFSGELNLEEVIDMRKKLLKASKERKGVYDLKLGKGSLIDCEFYAQVLSIKKKIREPSTLKLLKSFDPNIYRDYLFLRSLETRVRILRERETSLLYEEDLPLLSKALGEERLRDKLLEVRERLSNLILKSGML